MRTIEKKRRNIVVRIYIWVLTSLSKPLVSAFSHLESRGYVFWKQGIFFESLSGHLADEVCLATHQLFSEEHLLLQNYFPKF